MLTIFAFSILINISRFFELRPVESTEKVLDLVNGTFVLRWVGTGFSSQIGTKLRDWAVWQARAGCYSQAAAGCYYQAALSSND